MSIPTSKTATPSPAETMVALREQADGAWAALLRRQGDVRHLVEWLRDTPGAAEPADSGPLLLQVLEAGHLTLALLRMADLDGKIRECATAGRNLDL